MSIRIVLVGTTHPGNIGAVARAMKNMGLADLALVTPRFFPDEQATARASGADSVLQNATVHETLAAAVEDCSFVLGASGRARALSWPTVDPREAAAELLQRAASGPVAAVFGPEKHGLANEHLDLCDVLMAIPTDPEFSSLNLAMAVQVLAYEIRMATAEPVPRLMAEAEPATSGEMEYFYEHLERVLRDIRFLDPDNPRHLMRRLRRLFIRAEPDKNEVNILRGILTAVERRNGGEGGK